ncbi:MAG: hypothetical protein CM15mP74_18680 [Halieaceae bacterium]|nr:MAG: hypothetical protein CM15mP74_18680 [Halieaceae bacterium]
MRLEQCGAGSPGTEFLNLLAGLLETVLVMRQVRASLGLEQLTFKQIRYFQAIAEAGSFRERQIVWGHAASLTVQIATLESTLNTPLFERQRSGVVLTPIARDLCHEPVGSRGDQRIR